MTLRHAANLGLLAALSVATLSITLVVRGAHDAPAPSCIAIGDHVPAMSAIDVIGRPFVIAEPSREYTILVYTHSGELDAIHQNALEELAGSLSATAPVEFVTITETRPISPVANVFPHTNSLLIDENGAMASVLGAYERQPLVCVIDPAGTLLYRTALAGETTEGIQRIREVISRSSSAMAMTAALAEN